MTKTAKHGLRTRALNKSVNLTILVLKAALKLGFITVDSFFPKKYPQAKIWRDFLGLDAKRKYSRQTLSNTLSKLKKQGLVATNDGQWKLTLLGKIFANKINKSTAKNLSKPDGVARLVLFDIPERERKKRAWLRVELMDYGFKQLQKSVWLGFAPLQERFIKDLDFLGIKSYVHILSIKHPGTIKLEK